MQTIRLTTATALLPLAALVTPLHAQGQRSWEWTGTLAEGRTAIIHNVNGAVEVRPGSGDRVEVRAEVRWRNGDSDDVKLEAKQTADGDVVVCAIWRPEARCEAEGIRGGRDRWNQRNETSVRFIVTVPSYASVNANSVNGDVTVEAVRGRVAAQTVNGSVSAASQEQSVLAKTVNGSIVARGAIPREGVEYETVNGSIEITLPADANADVNLRTTNGRVSSDFPITFTGDINPRRIEAQLGSGGPDLRARTVNGQIRLRKL